MMFRRGNWIVLGLLLLSACGKSNPPVAAQKTAPEKPPEKFTPAACEWPRFCGPKGDNHSPDSGLLKQWPEQGPKLLWRAKGLGHGYASVTIADGRIYTSGNIGSETVVTALDGDGKPLWQSDGGEPWTRDYPGTRSTPTIDGDRVYHESPLGEVVCLEAKTGKKIWSKNILKEFDGQPIQWGLSESLLIDGERLICCPGGKQASVAALDKATGNTVWTTPGAGENAGYASPELGESQGLRMIFTMTQKALIGVNADNGEQLFRHEHTTRFDVNATKPIYHDGHVFITSGYGSPAELLKITVDGDKASVDRVWESKDLDNHHGGVLLLDGYLYGSNHGGRWVCLEWKSGKKTFADRGVGKGSLTFADGMLYTFSENREVGLAPATPEGHTVVSRFNLPSGGEGMSWAYPVVCGGRLYLRHSDQLSAYDVRAGK